MTQTPEEKLIELAKAYARHRKALRENAQAIRELNRKQDEYIDLKPIRAEYFDPKRPDLAMYESVVWERWAYAVEVYINNHDIEGGNDSPMMAAARLLDERKKINAQGARIRNRLRIIGDQLLRAEP